MASLIATSKSVSPAPAMPAHAERTGRKVQGEKRKAIRRDPEKRRQQNLQAQKKYREKLRLRLDELESLAASVVKTRESAVVAAAANITPPATIPETPTRSISPPHDSAFDEWIASESPEQTKGLQFPSTPLSGLFNSPPATIEEPSSDLPFWDSTTFIDPSCLIMAKYDQSVARKEQWYNVYVDCGCPVRHVEVRSRTPGCCDSVELVKIDTSIVSPRTNPLRIDMVCTISAMWENCLQLGMTETGFCDDDCQSSFYRPAARTDPRNHKARDGASDSVVVTVQRIYKTLKPDLRPVREQVTVPHHSCLDVLPFPTLRKNLLSGFVPIDEDELFHDILQGLVCWGRAGLGKNDRNGGTGKASTGTPWDARSWEAKPWFIRKYWKLLGGEDGELVRQSEWWRSMRGEEEDIWAAAGAQSSVETPAVFSLSNLCAPEEFVYTSPEW